jgi:uncharacterized protein
MFAAAVFVAALLASGCGASVPVPPDQCSPSPPPPASTSAAPAPTPPAAEGPMEFQKYQLVLLRRGERAADIPKSELESLQKQHIAHLDAMADAGAIVAAGPFDDQQDETFRGLCLYRVGSVDEARKLAEADPMVKAGRLRVEAMTWMTAKGYVEFPKAKPRKP